MKSKRILLGLLLLIGAGQVFAQNNVRLPERPQQAAYHDLTQLNDGFWIAIEAQGGTSILFDQNKTNAQRVGVSVIAGYMFSEFLTTPRKWQQAWSAVSRWLTSTISRSATSSRPSRRLRLNRSCDSKS